MKFIERILNEHQVLSKILQMEMVINYHEKMLFVLVIK